jgi:hypothetical protein
VQVPVGVIQEINTMLNVQSSTTRASSVDSMHHGIVPEAEAKVPVSESKRFLQFFNVECPTSRNYKAPVPTPDERLYPRYWYLPGWLIECTERQHKDIQVIERK